MLNHEQLADRHRWGLLGGGDNLPARAVRTRCWLGLLASPGTEADRGAVPFVVGEGFDRLANAAPCKAISWSSEASREVMAAGTTIQIVHTRAPLDRLVARYGKTRHFRCSMGA